MALFAVTALAGSSSGRPAASAVQALAELAVGGVIGAAAFVTGAVFAMAADWLHEEEDGLRFR